MAETPEQLWERAKDALRMPPLDEWETWPFEGELRPKQLLPPTPEEKPRLGETGPADCWRCAQGDEDAIWTDGSWMVTPLGSPVKPGLPVIVILQPYRHLDFHELTDEEAAAMGVLLRRAERAVARVETVGRVHVCRWGDGSYHLHWWLIGRPARLPQLWGSFAAIWDDVLPPTPDDVWQANVETVARELAEGGGESRV